MEINVTTSLHNGLVEREVVYKEQLPSGHSQSVTVRVWVAPSDSVHALSTSARDQAHALLLRAIAARPA